MRQIVNATQIDTWFTSGKRDAQELLPHLVRKLITVTVGVQHLLSIRIPVGDQVTLPGYDGTVVTTAPNLYVPEGYSVWEMGTGEPEEKAELDYRARTAKPQNIEPGNTVFIFVTPHVFREKNDWIQKKMLDSVWKGIHVIDGVDLDSWLDMYPGVARWLAREIGGPAEGLRALEEFKGDQFDARYGTYISP